MIIPVFTSGMHYKRTKSSPSISFPSVPLCYKVDDTRIENKLDAHTKMRFYYFHICTFTTTTLVMCIGLEVEYLSQFNTITYRIIQCVGAWIEARLAISSSWMKIPFVLKMWVTERLYALQNIEQKGMRCTSKLKIILCFGVAYFALGFLQFGENVWAECAITTIMYAFTF